MNKVSFPRTPFYKHFYQDYFYYNRYALFPLRGDNEIIFLRIKK